MEVTNVAFSDSRDTIGQSTLVPDPAATQLCSSAGPDTASTAVKEHSNSAKTLAALDANQHTEPPDPTSNLLQVISYNAAKRNNLHMLDDETLVMAVGCVVLLLHMPTMQQRFLPGRDGGGVAAVAVHPSRQQFLVAERCWTRAPNIYIYQYPGLELVQTLQHGTSCAYSCAGFSSDGSMIASVGSAPDYLLTLWECKSCAPLLRCKAFSQEVYNMRFSPYFSGNLVTCGTGHIRFWKMATTFTGMKLQGDIGKFGSLELSDITAFVEMPDGKVFSGSEAGYLLIWDGGLVKATISRPGGAPCHEGPVEVLLHDMQTNYMLSGGGDGVMRLWDFNKLNDAQPADGSSCCELKPAAEVLLPGAGCPRGVLWEKRSWLVQSDAGALYRVLLPINLLDSKGYVATKLLDLHSGAVLGAYTCPDRHVVITAAANGNIRALDYKSNEVLQQRQFSDRASCMAMVPFAVGCGQCTVVLGFTNGSLRLVRRCSDGWRLVAASRPHKASVSSVAVSPDGARLAAVAADGHAFFYQLTGGSLIPQLGCQLAVSSPSHSCWSPDCNHLLVGFTCGVVVELSMPLADSIDTSRTFEHSVPNRTYTVKRPAKQQQTRQHVQLSQDKSPAISVSSQQPPSEASMEAADAAAAAANQQLFAELSQANDSSEEQPLLPVTWLSYKADDSSRFLVWVGGQAAGQVLECSWEQPTALTSSAACFHAAITSVGSSWSGQYAIYGSADGAVLLEGRLLTGQKDGRQWQCPLHGMQDNPVSALAMAYDDSCLLTASGDGSLFLISNPLGQTMSAADPAEPSAALPRMQEDAASADGQLDVPDLPAGVQTLEEEKQAVQRNQQAAAAAAARGELLAEIEALRVEYSSIVAENEARPPGQRVPRHMLEVDAGLEALIEHERSERLADAQAQVAYDAEVAHLQFSKLQQYFTANMAVHHIILHSLSGSNTVSTFRQADLPRELLLCIEEAEREAVAQRLLQQESRREVLKTATASKKSHSLHDMSGASEMSSPGLPSLNALSVLSRAELWRHSKKARAAEWAAFNASRPDESYEAPADIAALAEAAASIGDYKLKSKPGYVLPEDQRMAPSKKRRQMLLLQRDMAAARSSFNARVLELRDDKRALLIRLSALRSRLLIINQLLGISEFLPALVMLPEEEPELQLNNVTKEQIAEHQAAKKAVIDKLAGAAIGGLGGFAAAGGKGIGADKAGAADAARKGAAAGGAAGTKLQAAGSAADAMQQCATAAVELSSTAAPMLSCEQQRQLQVERQQLLSDISALCSAFDALLAAARAARFELAIGLKAAEQQLLLMTRELRVLNDAVVQELVLEGKRSAKAAEQADLASRLAEVGRALDAKKAEGEAAAAAKTAVVAELEVLLADQDAFTEQLTKVFNRRIKRSRRSAGRGNTGDWDISDSEVSLSEGDTDSGSDGNDGEEVGLPPGCDPGLYDRVVELRERRLDKEEVAAEVTKALEGIKKERELLSKKARLLELSLAAINQSVLEYQQEKQAKLNQLPAIVSLRLHQVELLEGRRLPAGLSGAVVFSQQQLTHLKQRMQELDKEHAALRQQQNELRHQHAQLQADKGAKQAHLAELTAKCRDVQLLKFGQIIDAALLDTIGIRNKGADELREALKQQAYTGSQELAAWDAKIAAKKRDLLSLSHQNTSALNTVTVFNRTQRELEAAVMADRSALWTDPLDSRRTALAERDRRVATINQQAGELDSLRKRIAALQGVSTHGRS